MIIIIKHKNHYESGIGTYIYWHTIEYPHSTWKYDCKMSDEGMAYLIGALRQGGSEVTYKVED